MTMISRIKDWLGFSRSVHGFQMDSPSGVQPDYSLESLVASYKSWTYCCAAKNAGRVASVPLRLYGITDEGMPEIRAKTCEVGSAQQRRLKSRLHPRFKESRVDEVLSHPLLDLLSYVNEDMGRFELFNLTDLGMELAGSSYWWLQRDTLGVPSGIIVLPPQMVRIKLSESTGRVESYLLGSGTKEKAIPADDVVQFRMPDPSGGLYGMAPAAAAWEAICSHRSMQQYESALNRNMGVPSLFIQYEGNVVKGELDRIEADWNRKLRGTSKSGKVMVGDQKFKVTPVGMSPRDMSFREGRAWMRTEIAACFGVPQDLLDTSQANSNRATATVANATYEQFTILPRLELIADKLNERLLPLYDPRLFVAFDNNVPDDREAKVTQSVALVSAGIITVDEARAEFNLPPMEQEDEDGAEADGEDADATGDTEA